VSVVYLARVAADELKPVAGDDAAAVAWFPLGKLPPLAFDHAAILDRVRHRLADRAG
jgi:8-oxo-dGTP diphosphatase